MNKIGILLTSPKEVGGIYQYSLSVIEALNLLQKKRKFEIEYYYSDKHWEKHIPKISKKVYVYKGLFKKFLRRLIYLFLSLNFWNKLNLMDLQLM